MLIRSHLINTLQKLLVWRCVVLLQSARSALVRRTRFDRVHLLPTDSAYVSTRENLLADYNIFTRMSYGESVPKTISVLCLCPFCSLSFVRICKVVYDNGRWHQS